MNEMNESGRNPWSRDGECWACSVIAGTASASVALDHPMVLVLINPLPLNPGHALVIPRRHIRNLYELPDEFAGPILTAAAQVARAAKRAFAADGITLRQNNDPASDQHLFHFHLHVIPRFEGDGERFGATPTLSSRAEQESAAALLRAALTIEERGAQ